VTMMISGSSCSCSCSVSRLWSPTHIPAASNAMIRPCCCSRCGVHADDEKADVLRSSSAGVVVGRRIPTSRAAMLVLLAVCLCCWGSSGTCIGIGDSIIGIGSVDAFAYQKRSLGAKSNHRYHRQFRDKALSTSSSSSVYAPVRQGRGPLFMVTTKESSQSKSTTSESSSKIAAPSNSGRCSNWSICPVEALSGSISPFVAGNSGSRTAAATPIVSNPQSSDGEDDAELADDDDESMDRWSASAYKSALDLHTALVEYCATHDNHQQQRVNATSITSTNDNKEQHTLSPHLITIALETLHQSYRLYGPQSVVGSYNGGKDAVAILHLMRAAYAAYLRDEAEEDIVSPPSDDDTIPLSAADNVPEEAIRPRVTYFEHEDEFPEVVELLHATVDQFDLNMVAFEKGIKFSDGLRLIVDTNFVVDDDLLDNTYEEGRQRRRPYPMAFVLGTRSSDPNAGTQQTFAPSTSSFMPPFMRVNPILDWTYGDVWTFLRMFDLPYCKLYDEGYTSLGTVKDTMPCPALAKDVLELGWGEGTGNTVVEGCEGEYWPAYMLDDWDQERAGRISKKKKKKKKK